VLFRTATTLVVIRWTVNGGMTDAAGYSSLPVTTGSPRQGDLVLGRAGSSTSSSIPWDATRPSTPSRVATNATARQD